MPNHTTQYQSDNFAISANTCSFSVDVKEKPECRQRSNVMKSIVSSAHSDTTSHDSDTPPKAKHYKDQSTTPKSKIFTEQFVTDNIKQNTFRFSTSVVNRRSTTRGYSRRGRKFSNSTQNFSIASLPSYDYFNPDAHSTKTTSFSLFGINQGYVTKRVKKAEHMFKTKHTKASLLRLQKQQTSSRISASPMKKTNYDGTQLRLASRSRLSKYQSPCKKITVPGTMLSPESYAIPTITVTSPSTSI